MTRSPEDCFDYGGSLMPVREARARLRQAATCVVGNEMLDLEDARGRILEESLIADRDVPGFDNVAVDGWAFAMPPEGLTDAPIMLVQEGRAAAGHPFKSEVARGHALRVLTGAAMPSGTDTVALQEEAELLEGFIRLPRTLRKGANRRRRGEDMARDAIILPQGHRLRPQDIGVAAELGRNSIKVFKKLRVAIFSCGDEVHEPGTPLTKGGLFDANRPMLKSFFASLPVTITDLGIVPDDPKHVARTIGKAACDHDLILASGGASQGDEDHVVRVVADQGSLHFWRIALKPGRPLGIGKIGRAFFIGLPGNPVAAMVCSILFARPLALVMAGTGWLEPRRTMLPGGFAMTKRAGRSEYVRARIVDGRVQRIARQGSGILTSLVEAEGLVELDDEVTSVRPGDPLPFLSFDALGL